MELSPKAGGVPVSDAGQERPTIVIRSEEDAWSVLEQALDDQLDADHVPDVRFEGWPRLQIKVELPNSTITPPIMAALLELQAAVYRSHAIYRYGTRSLTKITNDERAALELAIKVSAGSSQFDIDGQQIVNELINSVAGNMDGTETVIAIVGVALILFGRLAWKDYFDARARTRSEEVQSEERRAQLEQVRYLSEQETERVRILANAIGEARGLSQVDEETDEARHELLKSLPADANIGGASLPADLAHELATNARQRSEQVTVSGTFSILRVDTTVPDGFRVRLQALDEDVRFTAGVQDILISEDQRRVIREAEWSKQPIRASIDAKRRGNQLVDAVIREVEPVERH